MTALHQIQDLQYQEFCEKWKQAKRNLKEAEAFEEAYRKQLIDMAGGERLEHGVEIKHFSRKGSVQWKKIPEIAFMEEDYIEKFRAAPSEYWSVRVY